MVTLENLAKSKLKKIEYHTGGSVWSIRVTMSDGRQSPIFGTKNVVDAEVTLDPSRDIREIQMLSSDDDKYVNAIRLCERGQSSELDQATDGSASERQPVVEIIGNDYEGHWHKFEL